MRSQFGQKITQATTLLGEQYIHVYVYIFEFHFMSTSFKYTLQVCGVKMFGFIHWKP